MPKHFVRHIYTLRDVPPGQAGVLAHEHLPLGRFHASHIDRPARGISVIGNGRVNGVFTALSGGLECSSTYDWELWQVGHGQGLLHIQHEVDAPAGDIAKTLRLFCDARHELRFDGMPLLEWAADAAGLSNCLCLMPDVLQIVEFDSASRAELGDSTAPSSTAIGIIHRTNGEHLHIGAGRLPAALNYAEGEFAIHGRGVILLSGHPEDRMNALLLTASELLVASGRARQARKVVEERLSAVNRTLVSGSESASTEDLQSLSELVRTYRVFLALEVRAFTDGLFSPELLLDSFRSSFAASLRLDETTKATEVLLDTLSAVLASHLAEARLSADTEAERRQSQWQAIVGLASGITIPIALILSYFSVQNQRIFDWKQQWPAWTVTLFVSFVVVVASAVRLWRAQKGRPMEVKTT
jgi:hypothetical protein